MLTGRVPYDGAAPVDIAWQHVDRDVPPPSTLVPGLPPLLDDLVAARHPPRPGGRPTDAGALLAEVQAARDELASAQSSTARAAEVPPPVRRPDHDRRRGLAGRAAGLGPAAGDQGTAAAAPPARRRARRPGRGRPGRGDGPLGDPAAPDRDHRRRGGAGPGRHDRRLVVRGGPLHRRPAAGEPDQGRGPGAGGPGRLHPRLRRPPGTTETAPADTVLSQDPSSTERDRQGRHHHPDPLARTGERARCRTWSARRSSWPRRSCATAGSRPSRAPRATTTTCPRAS